MDRKYVGQVDGSEATEYMPPCSMKTDINKRNVGKKLLPISSCPGLFFVLVFDLFC